MLEKCFKVIITVVFCGKRTMFQMELIFHDQSGHGARLFANPPGEKLTYVVGKLMELRKEELRKLTELNYSHGNVSSINLTILKGGVLRNVVPAEMRATFDIRLAIQVDVDEFERMVVLKSKFMHYETRNNNFYFTDRSSSGVMMPAET